MTNKKLIDHCNSFWSKGKCEDCEHFGTYCMAFFARFGTTPFHENILHEEYYTDEEIEYEN